VYSTVTVLKQTSNNVGGVRHRGHGLCWVTVTVIGLNGGLDWVGLWKISIHVYLGCETAGRQLLLLLLYPAAASVQRFDYLEWRPQS